jgi:hypothetical protein
MQPLWQVLLRVAQSDDEPLSCDECYVLMDYLSDLLADDVNSEQVLSLADRYLARCPNCDVEYMYNLNTITLGSGVPTAEGARVEHTRDLTRV